MPPKYTKEQTIDQIKEAIKDMATFYRAYCVNHSGTTFKKNGNEYYTEIISEYMLAHYDLFDKIPKIKRGDYRIGTRIITEDTRKEMKKVLKEIQDGTFASEFIQEFNAGGKARFLASRRMEAEHLLCKVGAELRAMMSWLKK